VFAKARDKAKAIQCISNLKQFGLACQMYHQDYDEMLMWYWIGSTYYGGYGLSGYTAHDIMFPRSILDPYMKNTGIAKCPVVSLAGDTDPTTYVGSHFGINIGAGGRPSYVAELGGNAYGMPYDANAPNDTVSPRGNTSQVNYPGEFMMWADSGPAGTNPWGHPGFCNPNWVVLPHGRHMGNVNVLFFDGHAKAVNESRFNAPRPWPIELQKLWWRNVP
jgi:prepilin-type processing-associated H-X9-DG protein